MAPSSKKRVCVIGAGMSGLVAVKECLHEGLDVTCYELDSDIGGIWCLKEDGVTTNTPQVWNTLYTNTTKFLTCFSDFQYEDEVSPYLNIYEMKDYYDRYAKHFNLLPHIQFDTRVIKISRTSDFQQTGKWEVYTCPTAEFRGGDKIAGFTATREELDKCHKEIFDFVLVCSGFFKIPKNPDVPGLDKFPGTIQHAFTYRKGTQYEDKTVLVVGNSFSAGDIGNDISHHARQVYIAVGDGTWIWPRIVTGGIPTDMVVTRRLLYSRNSERESNDMVISEAQNRIDHVQSGICPDKPPSTSPMIVGDDIYLRVMSNRIKIYGRLQAVKGRDAIFADGTTATNIDAIVLCTGYSTDFSFLDMDVIQPNGKMELFKMMLPLNQTHNTIGFIGFAAADAAVSAMSELQSRFMAKLFAGKVSVPPQKVMKQDVDFWNGYSLKRRGNYSYLFPTFLIADGVAELLGVYPSFWRLFFRDPVLAFRVWYGPTIRAQYRLLGPDSDWETAREICYKGYSEGVQSLRHKPRYEVSRDDIAETWKGTLVKFSALVVLLSVGGYLFIHRDCLSNEIIHSWK